MVATTVWAVAGEGRTAAYDGPGVATFWAGRVVASMCRRSMVKRTEGARGVGLFAALGGVPEPGAVVPLGVLVGIDDFLNLEPLGEEVEGQ